MAFGGGATDALFGAGSGTVLTKITKYPPRCGILCDGHDLSVLQSSYHRRTGREFINRLETEQTQLPGTAPMAPAAPAKTSQCGSRRQWRAAKPTLTAAVLGSSVPTVTHNSTITNIPDAAPPPAAK